MKSFKIITKRASDRHGGTEALGKMLTSPKSAKTIKGIPDDRWLSALTKCVFQAGFNWKIIEDKWDRFEEVFAGFSINRWLMMSDDDLDQLLTTEGIVKNYAKIRSVSANAHYLKDLIDEHGSIGHYFSTWKLKDYSSNLQNMQKKSSRLGGKTGQVFLRRMGIDTLVFTKDVIKSLSREGILSNKMPSSKKDWAKLQQALDTWHQQSGYSLNEISQILALSIE